MTGIAFVALGAWATVEGLGGRWGVTGRVFGVLFVIGTLLSLVERIAATAFLTSWTYWGLARLGYFEAMTGWPIDLNDRYSGLESLDEFILFLLTGALALLIFALTILLPPLVVVVLIEVVRATATSETDGLSLRRLARATRVQPPAANIPWVPAPRLALREAVVVGWRRSFTYRGRASRTEFWNLLVGNLMLLLGLPLTLRVLRSVAGDTALFSIANSVGVFLFTALGITMWIPIFAAAVRRLHDVGLRGWWLLVPFVFPLGLARAGTQGVNRFG